MARKSNKCFSYEKKERDFLINNINILISELTTIISNGDCKEKTKFIYLLI